jgi:O-antigen/teichoic acid export membrane protein
MVISYFLFSSELAVILPLLVSAVISFAVILFFLKNLTGVRFSQIIPARFNTTILRFSFPLLFVSIIGTFMHWMDVLMLGYFTDANTVGLYYPAARTAGLLRTVLMAFMSIFAPMLSEYFTQGKQNEMNSLYQLVVRWIMTLAVPIMIILVLFSKKVMLLFGGEYIQASNVLIVLTFAALIQVFVGAGGSALTMTGRPKVNLVNSVIVVVINVILNMLWIPKYQIMGAAWATFASLTTLGLLRSFEVGFLIKLHPFTWKLIKPIIAGFTTGVILYLVKPFIMPYHTVVTLLFAGLVAFLSFGNVLWLMKFDSDDREVWKGLLMIRKPSKLK